MTKTDLIQAVACKCDLSLKKAEHAVNVFLKSIISSLKQGNEVELRGFGCFRIRQRAARQGRNPRTGEQVLVEAKKVPYFKLGQTLKARINHI